MEFKNRIKELRLRENLTQEELAEKLFVNRSLISKWENGSRLPGVEDLKHISSLFGVSLDELVSGDKNPKEPAAKTVFAKDGKKRTEIVLLSIIISVISARIIVDIFAFYLELDSFTAVILHFFQETIWDILMIVFSVHCIFHDASRHEPFSLNILSISLTGRIISFLIAYICLYRDFGDLTNCTVGFLLYSTPGFLLLFALNRFCRNRTSFYASFVKISILLYIVFYLVRLFYWGTSFTAHFAFYLSRSLPEIIVSAIVLYEVHRFCE